MMSCIQEEDTDEHDSGSDATEESDSEEEDEESGSEEEDSDESDSGYCQWYPCDGECEKCVEFWNGLYGGRLYDDTPEPPGMTQARIDYEFRRLMNRREPAPWDKYA